jgi:1,2-diacylglycerol 3-beta-galactosyltransferase
VWAPEPEETVAALRLWLEQPAEREKAVTICRKLARPDASREIARILAGQIGL